MRYFLRGSPEPESILNVVTTDVSKDSRAARGGHPVKLKTTLPWIEAKDAQYCCVKES